MIERTEVIGNFTFPELIRVIREVAVVGVLSYLLIHLLTGDLGLDFAKLSASELVSILLAFFSIALSAAFYFAATSQSNQFYDNVNTFSKDTSELLGRLDEQVKGIGGRQTDLKDSIEKYYSGKPRTENERSESETEKKAREVESDLQSIVSEIFEKSGLSEPERVAFRSQLNIKDKELGELRKKLGFKAFRRERPIRDFTELLLKRFPLDEAVTLEPNVLLFKLAEQGPRAYRKDLKEAGYISNDDITTSEEVTPEGAIFIDRTIGRLFEQLEDS